MSGGHNNAFFFKWEFSKNKNTYIFEKIIKLSKSHKKGQNFACAVTM